MKSLSGKGIQALTVVHKLVGVAWVVAAVGALVLTVPALASGEVDWSRVALFGRVGSTASVAMLALGFAYALFTVWGFLGSRLLLAKWGLYLVAAGASGYGIRATREEAVATAAVLAAVQLAMLLPSMGIGVYLERSRRAGKLPNKRASAKS